MHAWLKFLVAHNKYYGSEPENPYGPVEVDWVELESNIRKRGPIAPVVMESPGSVRDYVDRKVLESWMGVGVRKHRSDEAKSFLVAIRPFVEAARVRLGKLRPLAAVAGDLSGPVDIQGGARPMSAGAIVDAIFVLQRSDKVKAKKLFIRSLGRESQGHMKKKDFNQRLQLYDEGIKPGVTPDGHVVTASTHIYVETIINLIESQTAESEASIHAKLKKQFTLVGEHVRWCRHDVFKNIN